MANTQAYNGFSQYKGNGSAPTYEQVVATIQSTNTTAIYFGDPVEPNAAGFIIQGTGSASIAGVFVGCKYLSTSQKRTVWSNYWPGSDNNGNVEGYIINDPNAQFVASGDSSTSLWVQAAINANCGYAIGTGSTASGISGAYLDSTTIAAATTTLPFRIVGYVIDPPGANGTETGAYRKVIVAFNSVSTKTLVGI
jgi:hypothetical protein